LIPIDTDVSQSQLHRFYENRMLSFDAEGEAPEFSEVNNNLVRDIRTSYKSGALTDNELNFMVDHVEEDNARAFLNRLASNSASRDLKFQLAAEGIGLTDYSDVGVGKRFASFAEKAEYVKSAYAFYVEIIVPNVLAFGWGFVDTEETLGEGNPDRANNAPARRGALRVEVPVDDGGTSGVQIGLINISDQQGLDFANAPNRPIDAGNAP